MKLRHQAHSGHKPNFAKERQRERFRSLHPEGRREYSRVKKLRRLKSRLQRIQATIMQLENHTFTKRP